MPLRVAVMGCVVNGPGEAREADLGVASGNGKGQIFVKGEVIKTVPESQIVETLIEEAMRIAEREGRRRRRLRRARRQRQLTRAPSSVLRTPDRARPRRGRRGRGAPAAGHRPGGGLRARRPGRGAGTAPASLGAPLVGLRRRAGARGGLPRRRQPGPVRRARRGRARGRAFAERARRAGRRCSTIVGPGRVGGAAVGAAGPALGARPATTAPASR